VFSSPVTGADQRELAKISPLPDKSVGTDLQPASKPMPPAGQTPLAVPALVAPPTHSSPKASAPDFPAVSEVSSLPANMAIPAAPLASNPAPSAELVPHPAPVIGSKASETYPQVPAALRTSAAGVASLPEDSAGANLPADFDPAPTASKVGQGAPAGASAHHDASVAVTAGEHPEMAEVSSLLGEFEDPAISANMSEIESQPATAPDNVATKSAPVAAGTLTGGQRMPGADAIPIPPATKSEIPANFPVKAAIHPAQAPGSSETTEVLGQVVIFPEPKGAPAPPPHVPITTAPLRIDPPIPIASPHADSPDSVAFPQMDAPIPVAHAQIDLPDSVAIPQIDASIPVATAQVDANPHLVSSATILPKGEVQGPSGIQSSSAANANSGESGGHATLSDASTNSQGKPVQPSGQAPTGNPPNLVPTPPNIANIPAPGPASNLLVPHVPTAPATPANLSAPPSLPPSQPPSALSAWQNYDGGAGSIVRSASLTGEANGGEMHVEFRSGTLGPMEVHAVMHEGSLGAEIHVQGQEAHTLLAAGLPSLERALGERNLRVDNIAVYQDQAGGGAGGGGKQDTHSGSSPSPHRQFSPWDNPPEGGKTARDSAEDEELDNPAIGLSVQA